MLFAILHCRNPECAQRIWVPSHKLGTRGRCPLCGEPMPTPAFVPAEDLVEGPHIMQDFRETEPVMAAQGL